MSFAKRFHKYVMENFVKEGGIFIPDIQESDIPDSTDIKVSCTYYVRNAEADEVLVITTLHEGYMEDDFDEFIAKEDSVKVTKVPYKDFSSALNSLVTGGLFVECEDGEEPNFDIAANESDRTDGIYYELNVKALDNSYEFSVFAPFVENICVLLLND